MTKILICGGRDYSNHEYVYKVLDDVLTYYKEISIVQGGAKGADTIAKNWAKDNGIACFQCNANWDYYDKRAGFIRNQWMLDLFEPDLIIAFSGGSGTANMIKLAKLKGVETYAL